MIKWTGSYTELFCSPGGLYRCFIQHASFTYLHPFIKALSVASLNLKWTLHSCLYFPQGLLWLWAGRVILVTSSWEWLGWMWTWRTSWRMLHTIKTRLRHTPSLLTTKVSHTEVVISLVQTFSSETSLFLSLSHSRTHTDTHVSFHDRRRIGRITYSQTFLLWSASNLFSTRFLFMCSINSFPR